MVPIFHWVILGQMRRRAMPATETGEQKQVEGALSGALRASLRGEVIDRGHRAYHDARQVWNGLIDRYPAAIARCASTADVAKAVRVAREYHPIVSVRGGGHQVAGSAVCDDGLVIDLSAMKAIRVDPVARTAHVQAGATWAEVDRATQKFGLATPGGEVSATGVAGLTLGGGLGVMMRTHGLSCDNLRSIEIVTADGTARTATRNEHADLFWAARGGGRGLGVVTSFEFALHPLGPDVAGAMVLYPYEDAESLLRGWRDYARGAPEMVTPAIGLWSIPPLPDVPEELHGSPVVIVAGVYIGPVADADPVLAPLRQLGTPLADMTGTMSYVESQSALDELFPDGGRYYWKSHFMNDLGDEVIASMLEHAARRPNPESVIYIRTLGGAIQRVADDESAYPHRSAGFNVSVDALWFDRGLDDVAIGWARSGWDALAPFSTGGVYLNFAGLGGDGTDLRHATFGPNENRLDRIRRTYDPEGIFEAAAHQP
jgi:FAD/FMN-containing dehydrogenase